MNRLRLHIDGAAAVWGTTGHVAALRHLDRAVLVQLLLLSLLLLVHFFDEDVHVVRHSFQVFS